MPERGRLARVLLGSCAIVTAGLTIPASAARAPQPTAPPVVPIGKVKDFRGTVATICGRVVTYACEPAQHQLRLDLDKPHWADAPGVLLDLGESRTAFGSRVEDRYVLAKVCATGMVERIKGRDMVRVDTPEQIVVSDAPPRSPFRTAAVRPCDANVTMPRVLKEVKPSYTEVAMRGKVQGRVFVDAMVMTDGSVGPIRFLVGFAPEWGLNESAINALRQWRLEPGTLDRKPVPFIASFELSFSLK